jgi:hypothetical protein
MCELFQGAERAVAPGGIWLLEPYSAVCLLPTVAILVKHMMSLSYEHRKFFRI